MGKRFLWCMGMLLSAAALILAGCAAPQIRSESAEDNPAHHYLLGMELLDTGNYLGAREKFERAVFCDARYAPAYAGLAVMAAEEAVRQEDEGHRKADLVRSDENLRKARSCARNGNDTFTYSLAVMRVSAVVRGDGWLGRVKRAYEEAMTVDLDVRGPVYYEGRDAGSFFMGLAYLRAGEPVPAREMFAKVHQAGHGKWCDKAELYWKRADSVSRALAGVTVGDAGKKIAVSDSVTRGDLAALLVDEMKLEGLFAGPIPVKSQVQEIHAEFIPADVNGHRFGHEIQTVLKWKVRGLEPLPDETSGAVLFRPEEIVNRGVMALVLEDILIRMNRDEKMATAYYGQGVSPFPDVRATSPLYNAVMSVTTRGIMVGEMSGEFRPNDPILGADALLAILTLRNKLQSF